MPKPWVVGRLDKLVSHTKKTGANLWARACREAGVESQTLHATRHTFITLARRGGARTEVVEQITHNSSGTIVDHYTHWEPLCQAVLAIRLPVPVARVAKNVAALAARPVLSERIGWRRRELNPIMHASASAWKSLIQHQLGSISIPLHPARSIWIRGLEQGRGT